MNRKEKEQNTDVSKQICVHKTQNTLLEFNSFLRMAEPKEFWHLHEDFASDYSRIRAVMVDYSKEDSISVYANLSPEIIKYVYSRIWNNVQEFKFFQQKIFCEDKNSNMGRVTVFSIQRKPRVFEELKILYNVKAVYIDLYDRLAYSKSDDRLRVIRELIKRDCLTDALEENQIERLAEALSKKPLSRWMQEDFKNILDLRHETAIWILIFLMDFTELLKELTRDNQVYFLLHNQNLLNGCSGLPALMDKLLAQDPSWKNLKTELNISDAFVVENKSNIQKFIYEGGAEIMTSFLNRQPKKKEEIRRIVNAELLGKFMELKYHGGDLGREIAFPIKRDTEEIWKEKLLRVDCGWEIWEEDSLLPVMQIGEVPLRSCISYRNGPNCDCLLSCFDANKKIIFIKHNGKIVFRAILRLTKGSFVAADERKTIEFVDVTVKSEPHENKAEELVLFLERYYQSGLSEQEIRKAVNLTAMLVKEKAEKIGARLVLSSSYKNVLENKNYVLTNFYMYISASKNGSQYLDSLGGAAGVSASGSYTCNTFLLEAEERREESL